MGLPSKTLNDIKKRILAHFRTSFPGKPLDNKRFLGRLSRAFALSVWGLHSAFESLDADIVPSAEASDDVLTGWAELLGLPNGYGGFGRLLPTVASGGVALLTGNKGTVYPMNALANAEDGITQVQLQNSATIPGSGGLGSITGQFIAVTVGTVGNLPVGSRLTWASPPSGADPTFTLSSPMLGALDLESNADVYKRIVTRLQNPPRGGVSSDYDSWARGAAGIGGIYVYPKRSGGGSVDVVIATKGSGQGRLPSAALVAAAQDAINGERPAGAEATTVYAPSMPNANGRTISVTVVPNGADNQFDWSGGPYTVSAYAAGPPPTLTLNTLASDSLKSAINAYIAGTGTKPRLQAVSTGSVANLAIGCVSFSDFGGQTTLTLESVPQGWIAPTVGDSVYPYGPAVGPIADAVVGVVDALGPSRASGFGDALLPWSDVLAVSSIIDAAEQAVGGDGISLITEVPVGGVTINGVVQDVQGLDTSVPELLWAKHVIILGA